MTRSVTRQRYWFVRRTFLVDDEIDEEGGGEIPEEFNANLVDFISKSDLSKLASDVISSVKADKESRSEWEKTYTDRFKIFGDEI